MDTCPPKPIPPKAWDTHHHIFEPDLFPLSQNRHFTPSRAFLTDLQAFERSLGIKHVCIAHGLSYGADCTSLLYYLERFEGRAWAFNITIEAEMGRIEGGEDGLPTVDMEPVMTRPEDAERFVQQTGVHFLAPSFGNIHGGYPAGGAEEAWDPPRLAAIGKLVSGSTPLALHETHPVSDELFQKTIECGVRKINLNRTVRDAYTKFVAENTGSLELTTLKVQGVEIYARSIERMMDVFGSSGRY